MQLTLWIMSLADDTLPWRASQSILLLAAHRLPRGNWALGRVASLGAAARFLLTAGIGARMAMESAGPLASAGRGVAQIGARPFALR